MAIESSVVFLPVKDIEETTRFYQDLIGLPVAQVQSGGSAGSLIPATAISASASIRTAVPCPTGQKACACPSTAGTRKM